MTPTLCFFLIQPLHVRLVFLCISKLIFYLIISSPGCSRDQAAIHHSPANDPGGPSGVRESGDFDVLLGRIR